MSDVVSFVEMDGDHPERNRDRPFDPYRAPQTDAAKAVVADVINQIENYEGHRKPRKRARRANDQVVFEEAISAIVCDLLHRHCQDPNGSISVSLSNRVLGHKSRYRAPTLGKTLPTLLQHLSAPEMDFVSVEKGSRREVWGKDNVMRTEGRQTTIQAGPKLVSRIDRFNLDFTDLSRSDTEEIIILKAEKSHPKDNGKRLEYEDTRETLRYRCNLRSINSWLARADLELYDLTDTPIDPFARRLIRIFNNGSFNQGGRLWGGFWMNIAKEVRRNDLTIQGEPVAELDFGQMALRLLYGKTGATLPDGDLYHIPGLGSRDGVKKIINAALYAEEGQVRMPQGARQYFPDDISYKYAFSTIARHHAPIAEHFFKGKGMELMFMESEILIDVLIRVREQGKVALPLHDGVLTSKSAAPEVEEIMKDVFKEKTGVEAIVTVVD